MTDYRYDVAFSFLSKDEALATEINDLLEGRVSTFLYSRRQEDVAGTDGYEKFAQVYEKEARVVVVILGDGWGERGFTLAEKTAIQNRAMHGGHGWSFLQVLPAIKEVAVPAFIPRAFIYHDWLRFGVDGACSVIEAHVKREGGEPQEPTFQGAAARKRRELELQQARDRFKNSMDGLKWYLAESEALFAKIVELSRDGAVGMNATPSHRMVGVQARGVSMSVVAEQRYANSLEGCHLHYTSYDTSTGRPGACPKAEPTMLFEPGLERVGVPAWRGSERWFSTEQLADYLLMRMVKHVKAVP